MSQFQFSLRQLLGATAMLALGAGSLAVVAGAWETTCIAMPLIGPELGCGCGILAGRWARGTVAGIFLGAAASVVLFIDRVFFGLRYHP